MFIPVHDGILVQPNEPSDKTTKGGIVLPQSYREAVLFGTVVKVGPGKFTVTGDLIAPCVNEGDEVMYSAEGIPVEVNGTKMVLLLDEDIIMVNEESE